MTSATGRIRRPRGFPAAIRQRTRGRPERGFTMVEILVVISIILLLAGAMVIAAAHYIQSATVNASQAVIRKVQNALDEYKRIKGTYPPDGFDFEVKNDEGVVIRGSACLYYFFNQELTSEVESSGVKRLKKHEPLWMVQAFTDADRSLEDPEHRGVREIVDGFKIPIHYDNTEDEKQQFLPQDGKAHFPEEFDHPPDPRSSVDLKAVEREGIQNPGGYDLWSHGLGKHLEKKDLSKTIASWNLGIVSR